MKLFSRKAIAAVAASVALTTAGVAAPAFADEGQNLAVSSEAGNGSSTPDEGQQTGNGLSSTPDKAPDTGEGSSLDTSDPTELKNWIGVFTAIIGALSTAFVFFQRITG